MTNQENAIATNASAQVAACDLAAQHWTAAKVSSEQIKAAEIDCINSIRAVGLALNQASGREQLQFTLEGKEFAREKLLPHLPPDMTMKVLQACCHVANTLLSEIKTHDELKAYKAEFHQAMLALGVSELPKRKALQSAHVKNLFSNFVTAAMSLDCLFDELEEEQPMETWPADKLDEFLVSAMPIKAKILKAEKIRGVA